MSERSPNFAKAQSSSNVKAGFVTHSSLTVNGNNAIS